MKYKVSIVIPAHNAEGTIESAVLSVIRQTERDLEVIVVDDASSDTTAAIVTQLGQSEPRVRLLRNARNEGPGEARNKGLGQASGQWVGFVDADDWIAPERLELLTGYGDSESADIVYDNQYYVVAGSMRPWRTLFTPPDVTSRAMSLKDLLQNDIIGRTGNYGHLKPLVKRRFLADNDISFPVGLRLGEDFSFHFRCLAAGAKAILISQPLYFYCKHGKSLSATHDIGQIAQLAEELERLEGLLPQTDHESLKKMLKKKHKDTLEYLNYKVFLKELVSLKLFGAAQRLLRRPATMWLCVRQLCSRINKVVRVSLARLSH